MSPDYRTFINEDEFGRNNSIRIQFGSMASVDTYVRRPVRLFQGLAKIGGFLGFLKVFSIFLSLVHEQLFINDLNKTLNKKGKNDDKDSNSSS